MEHNPKKKYQSLNNHFFYILMNLTLNPTLAKGYSSNTQIARLVTENWVLNNSYCPCCGASNIKEFENNRPVADFYCKKCHEEFELKSKNGKLTNIIPDGAYDTMIARINSQNNPNFFFLSYTKEWTVTDFLIIPKQFFSSDIIIKRPPLATTAKRSGWVGCSIDISKVATIGKVYLVKNAKTVSQDVVQKSFTKTLFLRTQSETAKGWILDVLKCVDLIENDSFSLNEMYNFEEKLKIKYPKNNFIKDKIRQQLQLLRDKGIIEFSGRGTYTKVK